MVWIGEKDGTKVVQVLAKELKGSIEYPEWAHYVKTGPSRERPPLQENWWYLRASSILRRIYLEGPLGVSKLANAYGGRKNLGHQPSHFRRGSRKIIRNILQQLEEKGLITKDKKGRKITPEGKKFISGAVKVSE